MSLTAEETLRDPLPPRSPASAHTPLLHAHSALGTLASFQMHQDFLNLGALVNAPQLTEETRDLLWRKHPIHIYRMTIQSLTVDSGHWEFPDKQSTVSALKELSV